MFQGSNSDNLNPIYQESFADESRLVNRFGRKLDLVKEHHQEAGGGPALETEWDTNGAPNQPWSSPPGKSKPRKEPSFVALSGMGNFFFGGGGGPWTPLTGSASVGVTRLRLTHSTVMASIFSEHSS